MTDITGLYYTIANWQARFELELALRLKAESEIKRLRMIINPGKAAAFEEWRAEFDRLRGDLKTASDVLQDFDGEQVWEQAQNAVKRIGELEYADRTTLDIETAQENSELRRLLDQFVQRAHHDEDCELLTKKWRLYSPAMCDCGYADRVERAMKILGKARSHS